VQEPYITVVGNVGAEPRMRVVGDGQVVTDFRIASTPRRRDKDGTWTSQETIWFGVSCWRTTAEHVAASLSKGDKVTVSGRLLAHTWTTDSGETRSGLEIKAEHIGFDLSRGRASLERATPLTISSDPGYRSTGEVDPVTGEVSMTTGEITPDDDGEDSAADADDEVSLGEAMPA